MAAPQNFRNALNGFNKDDVIRYLEYINTKYNNQINQLTAEAEELRSQLEHASAPDNDRQAILDALQQENESLSARLLESEKGRAELMEELVKLRSTPAVPASSASSSVSEELEAYRRAERAEREARKRADLVYYQANTVLSDATGKVDAVAGEIAYMTGTIMNNLQQLQSLMGDSRQALLDATALLGSIRPSADRR